MYLLDTNACIAAMQARNEPVFARFSQTVRFGIPINVPSIVVFELWFGATGSQRVADNMRSIETFLDNSVKVLPFDDEDARIAGEIRADLRRRGTLSVPTTP
jgi:tRNA(fMet)-specific endonuclease VapC